ncbi:hypothetical protein [Empedobacter tilapiae]|uniref:Uncharacterized protein n=1 Tax=Empedobacter tilapiae TaxID=2491114 RepID=A0A4Z1C3H2_9FLAO|nr:hypothetical protein [Empedobacter tilapiae]TGN29632.1 hypothetical protein E4J94_02685 [Empedobacter tilapiae]
MTKNIFGALLPQILIIIWAAFELYIGLNNEQNNRIIISIVVIFIFTLISIVTLAKVIKYPNDPTYLKKK